MQENRQVTLAAAGNADMLSTDDVSGKKSLLAAASGQDSNFIFSLIATTATVDYELLAGVRTVARGRAPGAGVAGTFPTETTATGLGPFRVFAGEELALNLVAGAAMSTMAVIERE